MSNLSQDHVNTNSNSNNGSNMDKQIGNNQRKYKVITGCLKDKNINERRLDQSYDFNKSNHDWLMKRKENNGLLNKYVDNKTNRRLIENNNRIESI